jgi:hypothetical protein
VILHRTTRLAKENRHKKVQILGGQPQNAVTLRKSPVLSASFADKTGSFKFA